MNLQILKMMGVKEDDLEQVKRIGETFFAIQDQLDRIEQKLDLLLNNEYKE